MALLYIDGFDHYDVNATTTLISTTAPNIWATVGTTNAASVKTMPILGGLGLRANYNSNGFAGPGASLIHATPASGITLGYGFHLYLEATLGSMTSILGWGTATNSFSRSLYVNSGGQLIYAAGPGGTSLANSGANALVKGVLYHIEVKIAFHASAGTLEVRVNGATWISATGLATFPSSTSYLHFLGGQSGASGANWGYIDNLFLWDTTGSINNSFLGERNVYTILPSADTATAAWAKSTGTDGFDLINDVPAVDTRFISTATLNDQSTFELSALSNSNITIIGVQTVVRGSKTDSAPGEIQFGPISNGTASLSTSTGMTQSQFLYFAKVTELNPDGNITWTPSAVNALQTTIKRSA